MVHSAAQQEPQPTRSDPAPASLVTKRTWMSRWLPVLGWLPQYRRSDLTGDLIAGSVVAIMLVPQGMAYAMLAGLPPQVGLYASMFPLLLYALLGSSRTLAVGPVAMVSLVTAGGLATLAESGGSDYVSLALTLALLAGLIQLGMGLARLGFLVNFLSHPVISGFTSAAALVIGFSQAKHLLGIDVARPERPYELFIDVFRQTPDTNLTTAAIGVGSVGLLVFFGTRLSARIERTGMPKFVALALAKSGPLLAVVTSTLVVAGFGLHATADVKVVGDIPAGLPPLTWPRLPWSQLGALLEIAMVIVFVGYMESIAVAKALASRRRQKIDANQELIALGAANLGAAFSGGYPVTGGLSRSVVNDQAGANTQLAAGVTVMLIALTVAFLTPLFYFVPHAVLAAVIVVAVASLVDWKMPGRLWRSNKMDAMSLAATFVGVLALGIETGVLVGVAVSLGLFLWRTSRPHIAVLGRVGESEHFRNVLRHEVGTDPKLLLVRVDESLYFANTKHLEDGLLERIADHPEVCNLVLVCSSVNYVDASAMETIQELSERLHESGVRLSLAEVKGPVMDQLRRAGLTKELGEHRIFLSTHQAVAVLTQDTDPENAVKESVETAHR